MSAIKTISWPAGNKLEAREARLRGLDMPTKALRELCNRHAAWLKANRPKVHDLIHSADEEN